MQDIRISAVSNGSSCDIRFGDATLDKLGKCMRTLVGKPLHCALISDSALDRDTVKHIKRLLTTEGFEVSEKAMTSTLDFSKVQFLYDFFAKNKIVEGDVVVCVGESRLISLVAFAANSWAQNILFACVPTTLDALVTCPASPLALDTPNKASSVQINPTINLCVADINLMEFNKISYLYMMRDHLCESKESFSDFMDSVDDIMAENIEVIGRVALNSARYAGRILQSTSVANRATLTYGNLFADGLKRLLPDANSADLLAEGMRFSARLAVSAVDADVDFVKMQDELLDFMEFEPIHADIDSTKLVDSIKAAAHEHTSRYLFALPAGAGVMRLVPVSDELLYEHASAWCKSHRTLC